MQCLCIDTDYDSNLSLYQEKDRKARTQHNCCECDRIIQSGELYRLETGKWGKEFARYKTCQDCLSLRNEFFCSWIFGQVRDLLIEELEWDLSIASEESINRLTKNARNWIFGQIERIQSDEENGG